MAKKPYKLLARSFDGFDKDGNRKRYEAGDMVDLTDDQFKAFKDQFVEPEAPKAASTPAKEEKKPSTAPAGTGTAQA